MLLFAVMAVGRGLATLALLTIARCSDLSAPFFDEGENLSYKGCGVVKKDASKPFVVYLRKGHEECYGYAISPRTILATNCSMGKAHKASISAYEGQCADQASFYTDQCFGSRVKVTDVSEIVMNPNISEGGDDIKFKIFKTATGTLLTNTTPICLFNRPKEKHRNFIFSKLYRHQRFKNFHSIRKTRSCELCLSKSSSEMDEVHSKIGLPSHSLLCVRPNDHEYGLLDFSNGKYFLRGMKISHPLLEDSSCSAFVDILPFVEQIVRRARNINLLSATPPVEKIKDFSSDENLSVPGCGMKAKKPLMHQPWTRGGVFHSFFADQEKEDEHPWNARVEYRVNSSFVFECGGTLISRKTVLTAAHCIFGKEAKDVQVVIGMYDTSRTNDSSIQRKTASKLIIHPNYKNRRNNADVGLIIFDQDFHLDDHVRPICLWNEDTDINKVAGNTAVAVGFGNGEANKISDRLKEKQLPIKSHKECYLSDKTFFGKHLKPGDNFCAGNPNGVNPGHGDSGGGLSVKMRGRWFIRGVVSFGKSDEMEKNSNRKSYTLFTDVAFYMDWIVENTPDVAFKGQKCNDNASLAWLWLFWSIIAFLILFLLIYFYLSYVRESRLCLNREMNQD